MNVITLDIETRPDPALALDPRWWEHRGDVIKAPSNWKDEKKIEEFVEAAMAREKDRMALSPLAGIIVVIGFNSWDDDRHVLLHADEETRAGEKRLLERMKDHWPDERAQLVTWNGKRFDVPFMAARCMIQGTGPKWWPKPRDYRIVVDLLDDLGLEGSLSEWQFAMGGEFKKVDGAALKNLTLEELAEHCSEDLEQLDIMAQRTRFIWVARQ